MAEIDAIKICSEALILLGEPPIEDFETANDATLTAAALYASVSARLLAGHPWRFSRRFETLNRLAAEPAAATGYDAAYQLPLGCYRIVCPYKSGCRVIDWQVGDGTLWLDATADEVVELEYHGDADETRWPPDFRQAVIYTLAGDFALPIREDRNAQEAFWKMGQLELGKAKHRNAGEEPNLGLKTGRFAAMRGR
jgi:hypothetical protein